MLLLLPVWPAQQRDVCVTNPPQMRALIMHTLIKHKHTHTYTCTRTKTFNLQFTISSTQTIGLASWRQLASDTCTRAPSTTASAGTPAMCVPCRHACRYACAWVHVRVCMDGCVCVHPLHVVCITTSPRTHQVGSYLHSELASTGKTPGPKFMHPGVSLVQPKISHFGNQQCPRVLFSHKKMMGATHTRGTLSSRRVWIGFGQRVRAWETHAKPQVLAA